MLSLEYGGGQDGLCSPGRNEVGLCLLASWCRTDGLESRKLNELRLVTAMGARDASPWTEAEEVILVRAYAGGKGLPDISRSHHRTVLLLEEKLLELGQIERISGGEFAKVAADASDEEFGDPMLDLLKHTRQREVEEANLERNAMARESLSLELESLQRDFDAGLLEQVEYHLQSNRLTALISGGEAARAWLEKEEAGRAAERARIEAGGDGRWSELEDDPWEGQE